MQSRTPLRTSLGQTELAFDDVLPPSPRLTPRRRSASLIEQVSVPHVDVSNKLALEEEFSKMGLTPVASIVVDHSKNNEEVKYVKAVDGNGEHLYVAVDSHDYYMDQSPHDHHFKETKESLLIDEGYRNEVFGHAADVDGVAFECDNGLCVMVHDKAKNANHEYHYHYQHKLEEETHIVASYPVVNLSQFKYNHAVCLKHVALMARKLRNLALDKCACHLHLTHKKMSALADLFAATLHCKEKLAEELKATLCYLEKQQDNCLKQDCPDKCKLEKIAYNIEKRNQLAFCVLEACQEITSLEPALDEAICLLQKKKDLISRHLATIGCVYQPEEKDCHCVWQGYHHLLHHSL